MHETNSSSETASPVARIEAQNAPFIEPMRKYLESSWCQVVVNHAMPVPPHYLICVGDADFVKSFFERGDWSESKKLAVIYEGDESDLSDVRLQKIKLYFIDPNPLATQTVHAIFAFFFREKVQIKNGRKEPSPLKRKSVMLTEPPRERAMVAETQDSADKRRIADTLQQIFYS
ncbi:MAG: hypothetical protein AAB960_00970, partial [Patescibacteria group bacterium]